MSNLAKRILFAAVAIPAVIALIWIGGWALAVALAVLGMLGTGEVYGLARRGGVEPLAATGAVLAAALPLGVYAQQRGAGISAETLLFIGVVWLLVVPVLAMRRGPGARPLAAVGITVFGALYASGLPAFLLLLRHSPVGPDDATARTALVLLPLVLTWVCDTAAMAAGSAIGGPKLAPVLSPRKTWAGAIGGAGAALVLAVVLGLWVLRPLGWAISGVQLVALGAVVGVLGQVGDVAESLFKREVGAKDSSTLIPGHGGVLDRLDSLYYVIPASAIVLRGFGTL